MKTKELSFKNDPKIKQDLISRMQKHIEQDNLMQKKTGEGGKGCTVWCALNDGSMKYGYDHSVFPEVLGLPEWLAHLQDTIFEGLNEEDSRWFSSEWVEAIPVGKDLDPVKWRFCAFILKKNLEQVLLLGISEELKEQVVLAIRKCLKLHENAIETGLWDEAAAEAARAAAEAAALAAARAEEAGWVSRAAWAAARAAAGAAAGAADAVWASRAAAFKKYADKLLELLRQA